MTTTTTSRVLARPAAPADLAIRHYLGRLAVETDVSDVAADLVAGVDGVLVVDTRDDAAWRQGRVPGAVHCPTGEIPARGRDLVPAGVTVVTYCWGPGCNGATRAALAFARLGIPVKEMIGGYEYWVREGFEVVTDTGRRVLPADDLTAVAGLCGC
jgi:rhodanese-related sulfurtransferase